MGSRRTQVCRWLRGEDHLRLLLWGGQWLVIGNLQIAWSLLVVRPISSIVPKEDNKLSKQVGSEAHQASNPKHSDSSGLAPQRCASGRWIHWLQDSCLFRLCQGISSSALPQASSYGLNCGFSSNWILHYFPLFVRPSVRPSVCVCVTGVTSHISHIYKGIDVT